MRLRHIAGSEEFVENNRYTVSGDDIIDINSIFGNDNPLHIEIGMGKGKFIRTLSVKNPGINYIGIEKYATVLMKAIKRMEQENDYKNLRFICCDAFGLTDILGMHKVEKIYLNFSDPWPKKCYEKRRLTSSRFLELYKSILVKGGDVEFKTDNKDLFDYSLESFKNCGWEITYCSFDFHNEAESKDNIMTEYEEKFSGKGNKICKLCAHPIL